MHKSYCLFVGFFIFFSIILTCISNAESLTSLYPKDKTITGLQTIKLIGTGVSLTSARVNGIILDVKNNSFTCGLILTPGKNFAKIEVWDATGNYETYTRRILKIVTFPDVDALYNGKTHWARNSIITLATLGIIEGYPDNNFYINQPLTRGELATWICRAEGFKTSIPAKDLFSDVPKEHWRAPYIKEIIDRNIMKGDASDNFGVDQPISRGEAALTALKAEGASFEKEIVSVFYDVPKDYPYYNQIINAKNKGLIRGISWKTAIFEPDREITRAETTMLLTRFGKVRWYQKWLLNFEEGYANFCKINTAPKVKEIQIVPDSIQLNGGSPIILKAKVEDREGLDDILNVKADISAFGGPPDAQMYDDGTTSGDKTKTDGEFTLQFVASPESSGENMITVTATDKLGWTGKGQVKVLVTK